MAKDDAEPSPDKTRTSPTLLVQETLLILTPETNGGEEGPICVMGESPPPPDSENYGE